MRHEFVTNGKKKTKNIFFYSQIIESSSATIRGFLKDSKLIKEANKSYQDYDKCLLLQKQKVDAYERGKKKFKSKMRNEPELKRFTKET